MSPKSNHGRIVGDPPVGLEAGGERAPLGTHGAWLGMFARIVSQTILYSIGYMTIVGALLVAVAFWLGRTGSMLGGVLAATAAIALHAGLVVPVVSALGMLAAARSVRNSEPFARLLTSLLGAEQESQGEVPRVEHAEFCSLIDSVLTHRAGQTDTQAGVLGRFKALVIRVVWSRLRRVIAAELQATARPGSKSVEEWAALAIGVGLDGRLVRALRLAGLRGLVWTVVVLSILTIIAAKAASMLP